MGEETSPLIGIDSLSSCSLGTLHAAYYKPGWKAHLFVFSWPRNVLLHMESVILNFLVISSRSGDVRMITFATISRGLAMGVRQRTEVHEVAPRSARKG